MRAISRISGLLLATLLVASCGGGSSSSSSAPVISNLLAAYGPSCTAPNGQPGLVLGVQVNYSDEDGDIKGGTFRVTVLFTGTGETGSDVWRIPADAYLVTGSTAGVIQVATCLRSASPVRLAFTLVDADGNASNPLTTELPATH